MIARAGVIADRFAITYSFVSLLSEFDLVWAKAIASFGGYVGFALRPRY